MTYPPPPARRLALVGTASERWACGHTFPARTEPAAVQVGLDEGRGDVRRQFDGSRGVREMVEAEPAARERNCPRTGTNTVSRSSRVV